MNLPKKPVLAGGLGALAASVWIPQLISLGSAPAPVQEESPAESTSSGRSAADREDLDQVGAGEAGPLEQLGSLEESLAELEAQRGAPELEALFARLAAGMHAEASAPPSAPEIPLAPSADPRAELEAFAARNPLSGVIHGPDRSVALLGHRVVRAGDLLAGGRIAVTHVGPQSVELAAGTERLQVELPAFQAQSRGIPSVLPAPLRTTEPPRATEPAAEGTRGGGA